MCDSCGATIDPESPHEDCCRECARGMPDLYDVTLALLDARTHS
jgi:hypothetical protein